MNIKEHSKMSGLHENCTSVQHGPKPLKTIISDAGIYCYSAITALSLYELFPDEFDRPFRESCLVGLLKHLDLPKQVESSMKALMDERFVNIDAFVSTLKEESSLKGNCLRVIEDLILFTIEGGTYDARMRVLIRHIAWLLKVALPLVEIYEESVVEMLSSDTQEQSEEDNQEKVRRQRNKKIKRYFMIGLATLGGGAVMGLTGGLAAPFVAAGAGAIIGGAGAAALGSAAGIAVIGSLFGVAGAGLTGYKMKKRVGAIEEFAFDTLTEGQQLHITLAVSGWLNVEGPESFQTPWQTLMNSREQYCLRYESSYLLELGQAMDYLFSFALSMAAQEALKYTILSGIISAIAWPATLITVAGIIDNPWGVCIRRSAEVGRHLAEVLLSRQQGRRPVTLVGFSLGARVIFYCLQEMAKRKGCEGIIEDVVLLGAPVGAHLESWRPLAKVVSGRIVNGYCRGDWLLKFLYRTSSATLKIAGLQPIKWDNRKMFNVDLSDVVTGHMDYANKIDIILKAVGMQTRDELPDALRKSQSDYATSASYRAANLLASQKKLPRSKSDTQLHYHCTALFPRLVSRDMQQMSFSDESLSMSPTDVPSLASLQSFHSTSPKLSPHRFLFSDNYNKATSSKTSSSVSSGNWEWDECEETSPQIPVVQSFAPIQKT